MLPMSVARSSSGMLTIGRIAYRLEGGNGSAQRGRSVIYAIALFNTRRSCFQGALIEESEVENPRDPSLFQGPDKDRQVSCIDEILVVTRHILLIHRLVVIYSIIKTTSVGEVTQGCRRWAWLAGR